jgi:hypothetical protein
MSRVIVQFSCGAASAVAAKLTLAACGHEGVEIVNAFVQEEDADNRRFLADCEKWLDHRITVLRDEKYNASTDEVWRKKRFIKGLRGAPCSKELKREVLNAFAVPDDLYVIGFTAEEQDRYADFLDNNPGRRAAAPLIDKNLSKSDCLAIVERAGIVIPRMYQLGFDNANCIGCPKGGINYWQKIRHHFPGRFIRIKAIQEEIGPGAYFLRFRSGPRQGERMALAELPEGCGNMADEPSFSCSFFCQMAEDDIIHDYKQELLEKGGKG